MLSKAPCRSPNVAKLHRGSLVTTTSSLTGSHRGHEKDTIATKAESSVPSLVVYTTRPTQAGHPNVCSLYFRLIMLICASQQ